MVEVWGAYSNEGKGDVGTTGNVHVGVVARAAVCLTTGTRQAGLGVVSEAPAIDEHVRRAPRYEGRGGGAGDRSPWRCRLDSVPSSGQGQLGSRTFLTPFITSSLLLCVLCTL